MKILFPTDFSDDAYNALFYAAKLYRNEECEFHILHATKAVENRSMARSSDSDDDHSNWNDGDIEARLTETRHRIILDTEKNPKHNFNSSFIHAALPKAIENHIELHPTDLIVMGNKGRKGAMELFFGNNTLQVVKSIVACPILCVPRQIDFKIPKRIAFLADYEHSLYGPELEHIRHLVRVHNSNLHLVHVGHDEPLDASQKKNQKDLDKMLAEHNPHFHWIPYRRTKASAIRKFIKTQGIDFLSMVYYRHYLLTKLLREPVVLDLSFYLDIPLLIIPDKD